MADAHDILIRKLDSIVSITARERQAVGELPLQVRGLAAHESVVEEGDQPSECCLVLQGLLCTANLLPDGLRQITSFFVPGDVPDLLSLHLHTLDSTIAAITPSRVALVPHSALRALIAEHPGIGDLLWRETLITGSLYRQWVVNTGRRPAYARIAHLLCELFVRLRAVGLAQEDGFELPLTQSELGDAAGLSTVHVNRVLQDLRKTELIVTRGRWVQIPDWRRLRDAGEFDPGYLHLRPELQAQVRSPQSLQLVT